MSQILSDLGQLRALLLAHGRDFVARQAAPCAAWSAPYRGQIVSPLPLELLQKVVGSVPVCSELKLCSVTRAMSTQARHPR